MSNLIIAIVVAGIILGGPLTLFAVIKILARSCATPKAKIVALKDAPFAVVVDWDRESLPLEVFRVRVDFAELVRGGRSTSFSVTFADRASKKKSFALPIELNESDLAMIKDDKVDARTLKQSYFTIEIETADNQATRVRLPKRKVLETLKGEAFVPSSDVETLAPVKPDEWSLLTRVFPWRHAAAAAAAAAAIAPKAEAAEGAPKAAAAAAPQIADFVVTKVWIEPGCIVCDACENEAPHVFEVTSDTCIIRPNAPLGNALSIKAAAEGCPVNVIKYDTRPA